MAVLKSIENESGVSAEYHRIAEIAWNADDGQLRVLVETYVSEIARAAGKRYLSAEWLYIPAHYLTQDIREWVYPLMSAFPGGKWVDAAADVVSSSVFEPAIVAEPL